MKISLWRCDSCGVAYMFGKYGAPYDCMDEDTDQRNLEATGCCKVCQTIAVVFVGDVDL